MFIVFWTFYSCHKKSNSALCESFCLLLRRFANPYRYLDMVPRFGQISFEIGYGFQTCSQGRETLTKVKVMPEVLVVH